MDDSQIIWSIQKKSLNLSKDAKWTIVIITIVFGIISFIIGNTFFGIFILLSGVFLLYVTKKDDKEFTCVLDKFGISIEDKLYELNNVVNYNIENDFLLFKTNTIEGLISIPIPEEYEREIKNYFESNNKNVNLDLKYSVIDRISSLF